MFAHPSTKSMNAGKLARSADRLDRAPQPLPRPFLDTVEIGRCASGP